MNRARVLLVTPFCLVPGPSAFAQTNQAVSLQQAIEIGLRNAYTLQIAQKNLAIAQNNNNLEEAGRYPNVALNLASNNNYSNINNPTSFLNGAKLLNGGFTPSLDATWVLFDGYKVRLNKNRLALLETQQGNQVKLAAETITQQVMRAYFTAQVQRQRLDMQTEVLALSRDKIRYVEARREFGQALEFDRLQVQDAYLNDSIQWIIQQNAYQLSLQNLALAMGLQPEEAAGISLTDSLRFDLPEYTYEELKNKLLSANQQLRNLRTNELLATAQLDLQRSNRYPRITASAGVSDQFTLVQINGRQPAIPNDWRTGNTFTGYINFAATYALYNGGRIKRGVENASLQREIAALQVRELERTLSQQLQLNLYRYLNQRQVLALSRQLLANAERNVQIAEEKFKSNTLNYFDLRTIQTNLLRSANAVQDAYLNVKSIEIDLLLSVGELVR